jgi:hypothetical protein
MTNDQLFNLYCRAVADGVDKGREQMNLDTEAIRKVALAKVRDAVLDEAARALAADATAGRCGKYLLNAGQPEALNVAVERLHALKRR